MRWLGKSVMLKFMMPFKGRNTKELAHKYHLTEKSIYEIIARIRKMEQKRRQLDLFG
jgi:Mor family transcriptional regulator